MNLAREYDVWHQEVFESDPDHVDADSPWYALVLEYLVPVKGKRILEIACGRGGFANLLASRGAFVVASDFSSAALQIAKKRFCLQGEHSSRVGLAQADAQQLPYASESFDIVISCETIEHLPNPVLALKEMQRVCRVGGLLYLTTPNYFNATGLHHFYTRARHKKASVGSDQPFDQVFTFFQVQRMLKRSGWNIVRSDGTVHQFPVPGRSPVRVLFPERNHALRRLFSVFALHQFLMAQKEVA
jgi:ubiquinone/menaquinone biosynthesis C-methylase UbiE